ncbi:hypothetical protein AWB64_02113 [Caballeronia sordidicola]|uniref:Transmembrane protein n=1 Tax=Caballeronia sordidicola TaxID=196367 RepID=A0A158G227_CABSO|nr:hypothetical protein [Caballeronia sordidicola]SAL25927.1 hypothetical protein AWB64_02113 [Caballeronia sordidicola]
MAEPSYELMERLSRLEAESERLHVDLGGGGGDNGDMEIQRRLTALETRLDVVLPTLATKEDLQTLRADLHEALNAQTWKIIGSCALLVAVVFFIARFVVAAPHP